MSMEKWTDVEEVNIIMEDGSVIHFNNPKVQSCSSAKVYVVTGNGNQ
jgi:hypothetical protein